MTTTKVHEYKAGPDVFKLVQTGRKKFLVTFKTRTVNIGDVIEVQEYVDDAGYTGRFNDYKIHYILTDKDHYGLRPGYIVMGIEPYSNDFIRPLVKTFTLSILIAVLGIWTVITLYIMSLSQPWQIFIFGILACLLAFAVIKIVWFLWVTFRVWNGRKNYLRSRTQG